VLREALCCVRRSMRRCLGASPPRRRRGPPGACLSLRASAYTAAVDADIEQPVAARLGELAIPFERYEHPPVATVEEASRYWRGIDSSHCKNLFLRNQKGNRHYLVVLLHDKRADLKAVADQIGDGKLSFASPERLLAHLGLTPGSVSPFGLMNDASHAVRVVLDRDLKQTSRVSFHPNINTRTYVVSTADFMRFLEASGNVVQYVTV
jgi:Ala-tRNA(Pro) deacylase